MALPKSTIGVNYALLTEAGQRALAAKKATEARVVQELEKAPVSKLIPINIPPDVSPTSSPDTFNQSPPDAFNTTPPDSSNLSPPDVSTSPAYGELWVADGFRKLVPKSNVTQIRQAQDALTHAEQVLHDTMWGSPKAPRAGETSRLYNRPKKLLMRDARIGSERTLIRLLHRLREKGYVSVEIASPLGSATPNVYRVFSYAAVLQHQRDIGAEYVLKIGPGVFYARPLAPPDTSNPSPPDEMYMSPPDETAGASINRQLNTLGSSSSSSVAVGRETGEQRNGNDDDENPQALEQLATVVRSYTGPEADDSVIREIWRVCRRAAPKASDAEILSAVGTKCRQGAGIRVRNLAGWLLTAAPKMFSGGGT